MQAFTTEIRNRVMALGKAILEQNAINATSDPDTRLVDVGLTSMDMVNLMLGVEAEFDFTIPQSEITPENFQSVETLEAMIAGQLPQATRSSALQPRGGGPLSRCLPPIAMRSILRCLQ